jgi:predicted DNA-binding ArsR family transcriptional regulator
MLEGDLRAASASLEASGVRVAALEVALGDAQKLLEVACMEGKQASEAQLKLEAQVEADATSLRQTAERMDQALEEL